MSKLTNGVGELFQDQAAESAAASWPSDGQAEEKWPALRSALLESATAILPTEERHHGSESQVKRVWQCIRDMQRGRRGLLPSTTVTINNEDGNPCTSLSDEQQRWGGGGTVPQCSMCKASLNAKSWRRSDNAL